ncbi:NUDIX hydrolase [Reinekea marinisedimentorum]|uniref:ADP-ribose pyrophosphatase YjhB (NUDIX family) n=1 Tax=Reinekea marinisedimentorum TaxID=230495 RepID=A0A4R3I9E5_9GAMM|nr:NUDIX hydrolase [Reinekea marinisedimentorum]TCS41983.1 ADP-ribose pyrophosphatase YjhB (NUDIX family) [Reinekea marinisedimentorum]
MNYCSVCGHKVTIKIPEDDHRPRHVCENCNTIHYQNPRPITCTLPIAPDGRIVLCRRNIEPQKDLWTLPGGFMENGETTLQGALRETWEEAEIHAETGELLAVISLPAWDQVHIFYTVKMADYSYSTTPETNEIELFDEQQIPWDELAFKTVESALKHYFHTCKTEHFVLSSSVAP